MHTLVRSGLILVAAAGLLAARIDKPAASNRTEGPAVQDARVDRLPTGPVYVVPIEGPVDKGLSLFVERAVKDAEADEASAIVFHVDTFGGLVDAADAIRKSILNTPIRTIAFIDHNAASAGALISYAADVIIMSPGSSIGAATVVEGVGGDAAPDKYQSYMRGLMRSTAEANGRDPAIAEAMVDEKLEVEGISPAGQVLTLSTREAVELGVADASIEDLDALLAYLDLDSVDRVAYTATTAEKLLRFFGTPVVQSILMLMMLGGLYFELQTPGIGFPGIMAAIGAVLFFGPHYLLGLVESWEILLFVAGLILLLVEIFVLPGFGIAGIAGLILVVLSLGLALIGNVGFELPPAHSIISAIWTLAITLVLLVLLMVALAKFAPRSSRFNQLVLSPELASSMGFTSAPSRDELVGRTGKAITALRPSGTAIIEGERVDVTTSGEYIEAGNRVLVVNVRGSRVEVRAVKEPAGPRETSV